MIKYKEINFCFLKKNNEVFLVMVSLFKGWGIVKIKNNCYIEKKRKFIIYNNLFLMPAVLKLLNNIVLGFYREFYCFLKLKGKGYKIINYKKGFFIKLGFSHRVLLTKIREVKLYLVNKQMLILKGRNSFKLLSLISNLKTLCKVGSYVKKGIFLKGLILKVKKNTKAKF